LKYWSTKGLKNLSLWQKLISFLDSLDLQGLQRLGLWFLFTFTVFEMAKCLFLAKVKKE